MVLKAKRHRQSYYTKQLTFIKLDFAPLPFWAGSVPPVCSVFSELPKLGVTHGSLLNAFIPLGSYTLMSIAERDPL